MVKLPRFVTAHPDRHGRVRLRFRRKGRPSHYFLARFGSAAFEVEYRRCLAGDKPPTRYDVAAPARRTAARAVREFVYFVGGEEGPVKIGVTANLAKRLANLQTAHPTELFLLASAPGGMAAERAYHEQFAASAMRGEWFNRTPDIVAEIARLNATVANQ